jgi:hypothetical protein
MFKYYFGFLTICVLSPAVLAATQTGCLGVSGQDGSALVDASKLSYGAYEHLDGGASRALIRAEHCAVEGVLRRNKIDSGVPDIGCQ